MFAENGDWLRGAERYCIQDRSVTAIETGCEMSIANKGQIQRCPTHPGEMLREDFLPDFGLTASGLASAIGVSRQSINDLLRGRRAVSPAMSLRLGKLFGNSPEFWLKAQRAVDLWEAARVLRDDVASIKTLSVAPATWSTSCAISNLSRR
jgi:antitoxin HigA-1